ncbi:arylamine N-acetyltransferase [Saccharomonospora sp. NPDC006951]
MTRIDPHAYLRRLGFAEAEPPSLSALRRLHAAHVERVPYETLGIQLGRPTPIDEVSSAGWIAGGRGGYCFHLNGAFSALLRELGYRVGRHRGGMQTGEEPPVAIAGDHLPLTVEDLPDPTGEQGSRWLVDVGLGDALHEPLPLREGEHAQGPFRYRLTASKIADGGWRFDHDPLGSFTGMDFGPDLAELAEFERQHERLSTSPKSGFVRVCMASRRDRDGVDTLRSLTLSRVPGDRTVLGDKAEWWDALADIFGISPLGFTGDERELLWRKACEQHERHEAAQAQS